MRTIFAAAAVCAVSVLIPDGVSAQAVDAPPAWTFGGTAGGGTTWDDEESIGGGWLAGGYVTRRMTHRTDVEIAGDVLRHERNTGPLSFQAEGYTTYLSAALVLRFGPSRTSGFVLGGGTIGIHRGRAGLGDGPLANADSANPGFIFGGGLSIRAGSVEIAPLVRMTLMQMDDDSDPFSSILTGVRIGFTRLGALRR